MAQTKFTISLMGFDERSTAFLVKETGRTMHIIEPVDSKATQVVVIDIDEPNSMATWEEFRKQWPSMPAVIAASTDPGIEDASFAEKPFSVEELIDCITEAIIMAPAPDESTSTVVEQAPEQKPQAVSNRARDIDIDEGVAINEASDQLEDVSLQDASAASITPETISVLPADTSAEKEQADDTPAEISAGTGDDERPSRTLSDIAGGLSSNPFSSSAEFRRGAGEDDSNYFDPETYMIGLVLKGIIEGENTGSIAKLECLLDRALYIDASNKRVHSNLRDIHMRQIAIAPLGEGEHGLDTQLQMVTPAEFENAAEGAGSIYPLETFLWELAILTSKGRLPAGTPLDKPVYLMQWPNFTRLMHIPNDMKVAAYWLKLPSSLDDLAKNLEVPMQDVQLLYSATSLTGLAGMARRKSDHLLRPGKPEEHSNRSLFGSIMNRLGKQ